MHARLSAVMPHDSAALVWIHARRTDRALDAGRNILTLSPENPVGFEHVAIASLLGKDYARAMDMIQRGLAVSEGDPLFLTLRAHLQGVLGQRAEMQTTLESSPIRRGRVLSRRGFSRLPGWG